jgi:palmitoyltransferase
MVKRRVNGIFLIQHFFRVNTCINFRNYKFFILFLGYGFLLCLFGFFTILPRFISFWATDEISRGKHDFGIFTVFFLFFVGAMFALSLGCLFFYHLYLTAKNQSTVGMNYKTLKQHHPSQLFFRIIQTTFLLLWSRQKRV